MKRILLRAFALLLALTLILPAAAEKSDVCDAEKLTVLLLPRTGTPLAAAAAEAGRPTDVYALTAAGRAVRQTAADQLDAILAAARETAHCCREQARWTAALLGLALEIDRADIPYLRALGDTAPEGERFDVVLPAHYFALDEDSALPDGEAPADGTPDNRAPLPGDGTVIAVIDSGFDADADWLTLAEEANPALTGAALAARLALIGRTPAEGGQDGAKVPFLYNYADPTAPTDSSAQHGTQVAALAAASRTDEYAGSAPGAQLLLMKVFGEKLEDGTEEHILLSAIDDALLLGADVINLSLGFPAGDGGEGEGLARAIAAAQTAGVGIVAAAGNSDEVGQGSFSYNRTGAKVFPTALPDRGTIAAPASLPGVISVGTAVGNHSTLAPLYDADGRRIGYTDSCRDYFVSLGGQPLAFADIMGAQPLTYVAVPGIGEPANYAGLNLLGRIALVERGTISFVDKTIAAAEAGAIGVIIYDNDPETDGAVNMQLEGAVLPAIFLDIEDGQRLAAAGQGTLRFAQNETASRGMQVRALSDSTARGLTDDFRFAPTLTALGENFIGLSTDGRIAILSGSSYAAPQVSGALAVLLANLRAEGRSDTEALAAARALLQNSAAPLATEDGTPLSVRAQGAGVLNLLAADASPLLLTGNDGGAYTAPEAGAQFTLTFTAENRTDRALPVTLFPSLYADASQDFLAAEPAESRTEVSEAWLTLCGYSRDAANLCVDGSLVPLAARITLDGTPIGPEGGQITLSAGERRTLTLAVELDPALYAARAEAFPSGFIVEGRITAETEQSSLSMPWAVFCGSWSAAPIAAPTAYEGGQQLYLGQTVTADLVSGVSISLGERQGGDVLQNMVDYEPQLITVNPNALTRPLTLSLCLLRNVSHYTVTVTDADGVTVYTANGGGLRKAYLNDGMAVSAMIPLWDGSATDNPRYLCPDGTYTVALTLYGTAGGEQTVTLPVCLDSTPPTLTAASMRFDERGRLMLDLTAADGEYIRSITLVDSGGYIDYPDALLPTDRVLAAGRGASHSVTLDASTLIRKYIYVTVTDYAYNTVTVRLDREAMFVAAGG